MELPEWGFLEGEAAREFVVDADDRSTILGAGAYGAVYSATMHGLPVAAKTLHALRDPQMYGLVGPGADPGAAERVRAEFDAEAATLAALSHPNVLGFVGVAYSRAAAGVPSLPKWIITEKQPYSLHHLLRLPGLKAAMSLADVTFLATDVAEGLTHLHSVGMVHRDLKPKNVLVGPGGAKVADLGTAKLIGIAARTAQHTVGPGTPIYHPPEVLQGEYSAAIDVFSLGLVVLEIALGESPRREGPRDPVDADQQRRALGAHPSLRPVVSGCLAMESRRRPTSERAVQLLQEVMRQPAFWEEPVGAGGAGGGETWAERSHRGALRRQLDSVTQERRCRERLQLAGRDARQQQEVAQRELAQAEAAQRETQARAVQAVAQLQAAQARPPGATLAAAPRLSTRAVCGAGVRGGGAAAGGCEGRGDDAAAAADRGAGAAAGRAGRRRSAGGGAATAA
jgi:hypothetical protein